MKATEQYFPVVLFIMLYEVVLILESVDESLKSSYFSRAEEEGLVSSWEEVTVRY